MSHAKILALLLLMIGIFFVANQYQKKLELNNRFTKITPFPDASDLSVEATPPSQMSQPLPTVTPPSASPFNWDVAVSPSIFPATKNTSTQISEFLYPNSKINSQTSSSAVLQSSDSTNSITDWYENKLRSLGYGTTSFVKTSSNNNILNKLVTAKNGNQVSVEIKKTADSSQTTITLEVK